MTELKQTVVITFIADYQMYGDLSGLEWGELVFSQAKEGEKDLKDYKILSSIEGAFGIKFVTFTVDMEVQADIRHTLAVARAEDRLRQIIGDSDVNVRWCGHAE